MVHHLFFLYASFVSGLPSPSPPTHHEHTRTWPISIAENLVIIFKKGGREVEEFFFAEVKTVTPEVDPQ